MAKRKIVAVSMQGMQVRRTTTLPLTHYWQSSYTRSDKPGGGGMSGFASSYQLAHKAMHSETSRCLKALRADKVICGEPKFHLVEVTEE